jgi:hypothetical protein
VVVAPMSKPMAVGVLITLTIFVQVTMFCIVKDIQHTAEVLSDAERQREGSKVNPRFC